MTKLDEVLVTKSPLNAVRDAALPTVVGTLLVALLTIAGNWYVSSRRDRGDSIRRISERVHEHIQKYYAAIASWASSLDEEVSDTLQILPPGTPVPPDRSLYFSYMLSRLMTLEDQMASESGGYFLRDETAEVVMDELSGEVDRWVTDLHQLNPNRLADLEYSILLGELGTQTTLQDFREFARINIPSQEVVRKLDLLWQNRGEIEQLVPVLRLKWKLLQFHINRIRSQWYLQATYARLTRADLETLTRILASIHQQGRITRPEWLRYSLLIWWFSSPASTARNPMFLLRPIVRAPRI